MANQLLASFDVCPDLLGRLIEWGFTASPEPLRKGLFDFPLPEAMA